MHRSLIRNLVVAGLCVLGVSATAQAGGWSVTDCGATKVGMYSVIGKVSDPTAIFHNCASIADARRTTINASMLAGFATARFKLYETDVDGEDYYSEVDTPELNYGAFPFLGITTDFGLNKWGFGVATYFPNLTGGSLHEDSPFRYQLIRGFFVTNYTSFAAAHRINDQLSIGVALDFIYAMQTGKQAVNLLDLIPDDPQFDPFRPLLAGVHDLKAQLTVDDIRLSYHVSFLYTPSENVRIGFGYFERVDFDLQGDFKLHVSSQDQALIDLLGIPDVLSADVSQTMLVPRTAKIGFNFKVNEKWNWGVDFYWWDYSKWRVQHRDLTNLTKEFVENPLFGPAIQAALGNGFIYPKDYDDSYQFNIGVEHIVNDKWKLRFGYAYDDSPIPNNTFTIDSLTSDSHSFACGFEKRIGANTTFGLGYQHIIFMRRDIKDSLTDPPTNGKILESFTDSIMFEVQHTF